jgi:hypothetical protein
VTSSANGLRRLPVERRRAPSFCRPTIDAGFAFCASRM